MAPAKRALLIGSSYGGLLGTENDVDTMINVLKSRGFDVQNDDYVKRLCGEDATRQKILDAWEDLASNSSSGDTVVIYYSGHGGLADSEKANEKPEHPSRIQFIVPYDFDPELKDWRGVLDGEISQLLLKTTNKTQNVTYILDCCHSARLGRKLPGTVVRSKALPISESDHSIIMKHFERLRRDGKLQENHLTTNPHAVRIAAAAADETAWEYQISGSSTVGLLTKNLATAINDAGDQVSWRNIMLEVSALVEKDYPDGRQHPRSAGPDSRIPFSMETSATKALLAEMNDKGYTLIQGGRVHGVREGDVYTMIPFGSEWHLEIATATAAVEQVNGFAAVVRPTPKPRTSDNSIRPNLAFALPRQRLCRWPASFPRHLQHIQARLDNSNFLKSCNAGEDPLVKFQQEGDNNKKLVLYNSQGVQLGSRQFNDDFTLRDAIDGLFSDAEKFAQAQHILSLESGSGEESFGTDVEIELGLDHAGREEVLARYCRTSMTQQETINLTENDKVYIRVSNKSDSRVHVSVFGIDITGKTTLVSKAWERGIGLSPGRRELLALEQFPLEGLPMIWPESVPREAHIEERFVFVMTSEEIDLRDLESSSAEYVAVGRGTREAGRSIIPYDVTHIRYFLRPSNSL